MSEHTKGPWEPGDIIFGARTVVTKEGDHIAEVMVSGKGRGESARNCDLVAAAPELLSSLKALIKGIDDWNEGVQEMIGRVPDYEWGNLEEARRVVARARGGEQA